MTELEDWLEDGDPGDADWSPHLLGLASRGQLGRAGPLLLDLPALGQRWSCATGLCTPGMRGPRHRSCCADLQVELSPRERERIEAALPQIRERMADDPRWPTDPFDGDTLARPGRRCAFARRGPDGLQCVLHQLEDATGQPRGALKPMPCRLFPLVIVEMDAGRYLLSAIHRRTARLAGSRPAAAFPCLGATEQTLIAGCADTVAALWGPRTARAAVRAVASWLDP